MAFQTLIVITIKYNLETIQINTINTFIYCDLDEMVYMKLPPGFTKPSRVFRLQKVLYSL